jgi:S-adenosylmethionine:diacylglycerol 3-amino-3-carboxypropyl transferase
MDSKMNERIQELMKQSMVEHQFDIRFSPEKFAELIVKECMTMSDELKAQYLTSRKSTMDFDEKNIYAEGEAACDVLKYKMKKHFGVEE